MLNKKEFTQDLIKMILDHFNQVLLSCFECLLHGPDVVRHELDAVSAAFWVAVVSPLMISFMTA